MDSKCEHENFSAIVDVNRLIDSGRFMADVRIECVTCKEPFHFLGILERGLLISAPSIGVDGTELHVPIAPGRLELEGGSRYEMPLELIRLRKVAALATILMDAWSQEHPPASGTATELRAALDEAKKLSPITPRADTGEQAPDARVVSWPLKASGRLKSVNHIAAGSYTLCGWAIPENATRGGDQRVDCLHCLGRAKRHV